MVLGPAAENNSTLISDQFVFTHEHQSTFSAWWSNHLFGLRSSVCESHFFCLDGQNSSTTTNIIIKKWTLTFRVRLYVLRIHRYWLRFSTLCNTKFGSHNSIHEIEKRKKPSHAPFHSHTRVGCEERKGTQTMIFFVSEHFVENSQRLCVFVVSSFDVQFNIYIGMNRLRWCSLPQCRPYTKTYSHSVIDTGSCGCSCCMTAYGIIREITSTMYAVFRPTPSDCTF